ncbi:MAG: hypothetical protein ABIH66_10920 [bacterium]
MKRKIDYGKAVEMVLRDLRHDKIHKEVFEKIDDAAESYKVTELTGDWDNATKEIIKFYKNLLSKHSKVNEKHIHDDIALLLAKEGLGENWRYLHAAGKVYLGGLPDIFNKLRDHAKRKFLKVYIRTCVERQIDIMSILEIKNFMVAFCENVNVGVDFHDNSKAFFPNFVEPLYEYTMSQMQLEKFM